MLESQPQPSGQSGKRIAVLVTASMVVVGAVLGYTLWVYSRLDGAREQTAVAWRSLATELDARYRLIEGKMSGSNESASGDSENTEVPTSTNPSISPAAPAADKALEVSDVPKVEAQMRMALDRFRTTAQITSQREAADSIETLLEDKMAFGEVLRSTNGEPTVDDAVDSFNARLLEEQRILKTPGGRILDIFLEFPQHAPFRVTH